MADLVRTTGDTSAIPGTLLDGSGETVNIQGASIRFLMRRRGSRLASIAATAVNGQTGDGSDGSRGKVSFTPTAAQVAAPGLFDFEWEATFPGGVIQTFPEGRHLVALFKEQLG
jgi:hypothetical protein